MRSHFHRLIFGLTILIGSFLLFSVQPILGKYIQPYLGSVSSVWNTCMMFFQGVLFLGYLYAHGLAQLSARRQKIIHLGLILVVICFGLIHALRWGSPILPALGSVADAHPVLEVLRLLMWSIGLPFFLLASNSTLMQYWYRRSEPHRNAYRLYAVSNVGSLAALLLYPIALEPYWGLSLQSIIWFVLLTLYGVVASVCVWLGTAHSLPESIVKPVKADMSAGSAIQWFLLTMTASILLLAITSALTQNVSPIPFLWVIPLTVYLLTFILGFSRLFTRPRPFSGILLMIGVGLALSALTFKMTLPIGSIILLLSAALFCVALYCHGSLYAHRPHHDRLTFFYLVVSFGGFAGGAFVSIVAPLLFPAYWELHIALALAVLLFLYSIWNLRARHLLLRWLGLALGVVGLVLIFINWQGADSDAVWMNRNFYGTIRVEQESRGEGDQVIHRFTMKHGDIVHGVQFSRTRYRFLPVAYFSEQSGIGRAILHHPLRQQEDRPFRIGVVGGGIGTLVAYARPRDTVYLYEINPAVQALAENTRFFTYLSDYAGRWTVRIGDGRLLLAEEQANQERPLFDLLAIDAFNAGAVPMHLLTREAIALYLESLDPQYGVLALQITNKHVDFAPLIRAIADEFRLNSAVIFTPGDGNLTQPNRWALLTRHPDLLKGTVFRAGREPLADISPVAIWTDDRSSLLSLLRF